MTSTVVFITGASSGIGAALVDTIPFPDARVVNIARRPNPLCDNIHADLTQPDDWDTVIDRLHEDLAQFSGKRAIFINNAFVSDPVGFVGETDPELYRRQLLANTVAPLVLGDAFLRLVSPDVEAGLVMVSSAAARVAYEGLAAYGAAKAAMEQWVRAVRAEQAQRSANRWVVAIRPGAVDTPSFRASASADAADNPVAPQLRQALADGAIDSSEVAARRMWECLPPEPGGPAVVLLGEMVPPPSVASTP